MQQQILWGERVIGAPYPFKVADLMNLPDDAWQYEIVDGELIRMPGSGYDASKYTALLIHYLLSFVLPRGLGEVTGPDGTYDLTRPGDPRDTALGPDVAFVQTARLPGKTPGYARLALTLADSLDGLDVLPGFTLPLATLLR